MVQTMEVGAMDENNPLSLASYERSHSNMGKFEEKRNARAISLCHVFKS